MKNPSQQKLETEIIFVTTKIQNEFPELYKLLSETPLFLSYNNGEITAGELEEYLASIKAQLYTFETNELHHPNV